MTASPTPAFKGSPLGSALWVLSRPEIRNAQQIAEPTRYDTRDGLVHGRPGDIAITAYGREQYPISHDVFLGTYEILGRVGRDFVAERLIHVRRAWEVLGDGGTFDYGSERGVVAVERGSWLYQSDDGDFGTIHPSVKHEGHLVVGPENNEDQGDWRERTERWSTRLGALPPVLTLLALLAFVAALTPDVPHVVASALIGTEVLLLLASAAVALTIRHQRWFLRACVQTAIALGHEFESAVVLLGHAPSALFPGMALWRAAQARPADASPSGSNPNDPALLQSLHEAIVCRLRLLDDEMHRAHRREAIASRTTLAAFGLVLAANVALLTGPHIVVVDLVAIWIPALVSAIHSFDWRRRTAERVAKMRQLADRLRFAQQRLLANGGAPGPTRDAVLRVLCAAAAQHSQHELKLALAAEAPLPV